MFKKVLIANRGEIAIRIARTAKKLGIATVAVYSDADAQALHVSKADEAVHIGRSPAGESYLRIDKIIAAAKDTGADCLHPGYGFLAENADLADACAKAGITFIGPSPDSMRKMGSKTAAKAVAEALGVPVVPGYNGVSQDAKGLASEAKQIGYPVMIKAVHGGGGRGMRLVGSEADFMAALDSAVREAQSAFGDGRVLLEKLIETPRHIEVQVFGDGHGNVVHMFERDCSLQRRHQKVIEEAPAPGMSQGLRKKLTEAAVKIARAVSYEGAGTVEFLVEGGALAPDAPWYFMEMNTRLQVEHPVTEQVTGLDLVEWQFRIAAGEKLPAAQKDIKLSGHAIEARLCAEDPAKDFMPCTGRILHLVVPEDEDIRVDIGVEEDDDISPFYDSLLAKLIMTGSDRAQAIERLTVCLGRGLRVLGPRTNAAFLLALLSDDAVRQCKVSTNFIGEHIDRFIDRDVDEEAIARGAAELLLDERAGHLSPTGHIWNADDGFQLGGSRRVRRALVADGANHTAQITWDAEGIAVQIDGSGDVFRQPLNGAGSGASQIHNGAAYIWRAAQQSIVSWPIFDAGAVADDDHGGTIKAPINGRIAKIGVRDGEAVESGALIAVIEAMKMEHVLNAPLAGTVTKIAVSEGDSVSQGMVIAVIAPAVEP